MIEARLVKRLIATHIGTNPETQRQMMAGEIDVELVPQGTLAERIRAGGHGLGGVLTKTGLGTLVEEGKSTIEIDGETWLLEKPLRADFALIRARQADLLGNLTYELTAQNFNPLMAMAAGTVIAEADEIRARGRHPARRRADSRRSWSTTCWSGPHDAIENDKQKEIIARRVAQEVTPGALVNLGIGLPCQVASYLPPGASVLLPV